MFIFPNYEDCIDENGQYSDEKFYETCNHIVELQKDLFHRDYFIYPDGTRSGYLKYLGQPIEREAMLISVYNDFLNISKNKKEFRLILLEKLMESFKEEYSDYTKKFIKRVTDVFNKIEDELKEDYASLDFWNKNVKTVAISVLRNF